MADVSYGDFAAAADRMLAAQKAGQPESPVDRQIFDQGDPIHGKQYYADYVAARTGGNIPIEQARADPSFGPHAVMRMAIPIASAIPDFVVGASDALADAARRVTGGAPITPTTLPSTRLKNAIGVPEAPPGPQGWAETGASLVGGALPAAGAAAANAAPGAMNAARAGAYSLVKNAAVAPALATTGVAASDALGGGEAGRFAAGTIGGFLPSVALSPAVTRAAQGYFSRFADPRAQMIADAEQRLNLAPRFGRIATPEGQQLENELTPSSQLAARNRAETTQLSQIGDRMLAQRQALPTPTPATAPYIGDAQQARTAAATQVPYTGPAPTASSAVNTRLNSDVGPTSPVDVGNTLNAISRVAGTVSPEVGGPLQARGQTLQSMVPPPSDVGPVRPTVPWDRARSWRTNLGSTYPDLPPIKGETYAQVYPTITSDLERAAAARGVPPEAFRAAMDITRGEKAAGDLRAALDRTLGRPGATGGKNFAQYAGDLSQPGSEYDYARATGQPRAGQPPSPNDISQQMADLALVARHNYTPPVQGGAGATVGNILGKVATPGSTAAIGTLLHMLGLGPIASGVVGAAGLVPGAARSVMRDYMQSPEVRNAMLTPGARVPVVQPPSMTDLIAALNAARVGQQVTR